MAPCILLEQADPECSLDSPGLLTLVSGDAISIAERVPRRTWSRWPETGGRQAAGRLRRFVPRSTSNGVRLVVASANVAASERLVRLSR